MQLKINAQQITFIKIYYKAQCLRYEYREHVPKSFWNKEVKAGFYHWYNDDASFTTIEELNKDDCYVIDKKVYYKPHIEIYLADNNKHAYFFESKEELDKFMDNSELKNINWIYK